MCPSAPAREPLHRRIIGSSDHRFIGWIDDHHGGGGDPKYHENGEKGGEGREGTGVLFEVVFVLASICTFDRMFDSLRPIRGTRQEILPAFLMCPCLTDEPVLFPFLLHCTCNVFHRRECVFATPAALTALPTLHSPAGTLPLKSRHASRTYGPSYTAPS